MSRHHPPEDVLMAYAAGSLPEPHSLVVATHLSLCPACRQTMTGLDALGGAMLDDLSPTLMEADSLDRLMARLEEPAPPKAPPAPTDSVLPSPLRAYVGRGIENVAWKKLGRGIEEFRLPIPNTDGYTTRLVRVAAGRDIPSHSHDGDELTLVLAGGFTDGGENYRRGDVAGADPTVHHTPVADADGVCICLIVTEGKLRFSGPFGPLLSYFRG
ncbi:MAG: cupin domain-containing protein [Rhodospirillaceae bacterium]|nr:cupin domain-containing protein [Rhodospirillaceae bacterium]